MTDADKPSTSTTQPIRKIAIEEHFAVPALQQATAALSERAGHRVWGDFPPEVYEILLRNGADRIADLDEAGIELQLMSVASPGVHNFAPAEAAALSREVNDYASDIVRQYPGRLAAMAVVAAHSGEEAATELQRATGPLGLKGVIVNGHIHGRYLDDPEFRPFLEAANELRTPIYLHPRDLPEPMKPYTEIPGFSGWITAIEESMHVLRILRSGVIDDLPNLQFVVGHLGGGLPFIVDRLDNRFLYVPQPPSARKLERLPSEYLRSNFSFTTSGLVAKGPVRLTVDAFGVDRVLFATDYPLEDAVEDSRAIESLELDAAELRAICWDNARRLYDLR